VSFISILGNTEYKKAKETEEFLQKPLYFDDLNLNQIVDRIRSLRPDYDLKKYY